ncbi:hypothetical protein [Chondromyces crocatus]|uniref:Uncharacterized protein n=1 Tax=Chondromyces crocatus TaxID=52 RepID=A0A0K1E6N0_CHOCO|nr:hypothetical protein [Chondromyces crocatus]AKT36342.1 uncharacterized protein CMC5_004560 [Chondromyces crocatus]
MVAVVLFAARVERLTVVPVARLRLVAPVARLAVVVARLAVEPVARLAVVVARFAVPVVRLAVEPVARLAVEPVARLAVVVVRFAVPVERLAVEPVARLRGVVLVALLLRFFGADFAVDDFVVDDRGDVDFADADFGDGFDFEAVGFALEDFACDFFFDPFSGRSTPLRRALFRPMATACFFDFTPCLPFRTCSISSRTNSPACVVGAFPSRLAFRARFIVCLLGTMLSPL